MSFYGLWEGTQSYSELTGDAFWLLRWNKGKTEIFDMWLVDPTRVEVVKSKTDFIGGYAYTPAF